MTTSVKVQSHNYPVLVQVLDRKWNHEADRLEDGFSVVEERVLKPENGEVQFHATTTRRLVIQDLEYEDPRATA